MLTALLLTISLSAPGDAIYLVTPGTIQEVDGKDTFVPDPPIVLTGPQKLELESALTSTFPGVKAASLDHYKCWANPPQVKDRHAVDIQALAAKTPWPCNAHDADPTQTVEEEFELELDTEPQCTIVDVNGNSHLRCAIPEMSADAKILNGAFTQSVLGRQLNLTWIFQCDRTNTNDIVCGYRGIKIAPIATWKEDKRSGRAFGKPLGKVAPAS